MMENKTIAVVGAGISGLSIARILKDKGYHVTVFEKKSYHGGLVHCTVEDGVLFHRVGGHVFNTKIKEVDSWFWNFFNKSDFLKAKRNAKIWMDQKLIGYPIENYIYQLPPDKATAIIKDLLNNKESKVIPDNFEAFLQSKFGKTLYDYYFGPYNYKIWKTDLSHIPLPWLEGKLPMPNLNDIIMNNIFKQEDESMVHSYFYYPSKGGSSFIADTIAEGLDIRYDFDFSATKLSDKKWKAGENTFDSVIYTGDVRDLSTIFHFDDIIFDKLCLKCDSLKSNGTSNALCYIEKSDLSWLYLPELITNAHRIIYTGNFSPNNNVSDQRLTCTVEFSGIVSEEEMKRELRKMPFKSEPIAFNQEPKSYVIQSEDTRATIRELKNYLERYEVFLLGRFAEWEYYNMDKVMEAALNLVKTKFNSL